MSIIWGVCWKFGNFVLRHLIHDAAATRYSTYSQWSEYWANCTKAVHKISQVCLQQICCKCSFNNVVRLVVHKVATSLTEWSLFLLRFVLWCFVLCLTFRWWFILFHSCSADVFSWIEYHFLDIQLDFVICRIQKQWKICKNLKRFKIL